MTSYKAGLHKKISSIFDGVPLKKESEESAAHKTSLPDFITEQSDVPRVPQFPSVQIPQTHQPSYTQPAKPVQKLYKDTVEKPLKIVSKAGSQIDSGFLKIYQALKAKLLPAKSVPNQKRQVAAFVLVPVLGLVLIFVVFKFVLPSSPKIPVVPPIETASDQTIKSVKINWQIPSPITARLRDPMKPLYSSIVPIPTPDSGQNTSVTPVVNTEIVLNAIVYSPDNPLTSIAVIGTKSMHVGEKIGDVLIKEITADTVTFEWKGQTKTLEVKQSWNPVDQIQ